jgi:hypothetical protein
MLFTLVDLQFGDGYAEKHPELVAAVIQADAAKSAGEAIHL